MSHWLQRPVRAIVRWATGVAMAVAAVIAALTLGALLVVVGLIVWYRVPFWEDPLAPTFSHNTAEELVAAYLCPEAPDMVKGELIASEDSGYYIVYVRSSPDVEQPSQVTHRNTLAAFSAGETGEGEPRVDPASERSEIFLASVRSACAKGEPPWPALANR